MPVTTVARLVAREVRVELAGHESSITVFPFVVAGVLLAGLAYGPVPRVLEAVAPGTVWIVVLFAAAPLARGVAAAERDEGAWDLLRGLASPGQLLAGKILGLWLPLTIAWAIVSALVTLVFPAPLPAAALVAGPLGTLGLAGLVVAFGALLVGTRRRVGLLAVLLLPAGLPVLLAGTAVGKPGVPALPWLVLLTAYDLLVSVAVWAVHPVLLEE
ncbi:heme exporter protein CcmB [Streptomyces caeni]|uniref:Heme exporter protein CcmB n=1 Tax=Streptomyces caeni TaxID=2307231 RepID=A0ABW4IRI5_9ACTN